MATKHYCWQLLLLVAFAFPALGADEGQLKYTLGADYSEGDYGEGRGDTEILFIPFSVAYSRDSWTYKASFAWVDIDGPGNVIGAGDGGLVIGDRQQEPVDNPGMGDVWLSASYALPTTRPDEVYMEVTGKIKLPTADEDEGLGTGETDYSLALELYQAVGVYTPFATLGYKIKGTPSGLNVDDVLFASAGTDYRLSNRYSVGVSLDYQEASVSGSDDATELFGYWNNRISREWSLMLYGYLGLQDGSPDHGIGIQLSFKPQ